MKSLVVSLLTAAMVLSGCTTYDESGNIVIEEKPAVSSEVEAEEKTPPVIAEEKPAVKEEAPSSEKEELPPPPDTGNEPAKNETPVEEKAEPETVKLPEKSEPEAPKEPEKTAEPVLDIDTLPNDNNGWGFVKKKDSFPEFTKGQKDMMAKYNCIYAGNQSEKVLYLTFDEGYENGYTAAILDTLKEKGVPAAFFITGPYLEKNGELIRRMIDEGHIVGNHSVNHPNMPSKATKAAMQEEILNLDRRFFELFGQHMTYFRPPEGAYSERSLAATSELGYKTVLWSFAYRDWETNNQQGANHAFDSVMPYLHNGCVILLHAVSKDNTEALGRIIDEARAKGYTFKSLDEFSY